MMRIEIKMMVILGSLLAVPVSAATAPRIETFCNLLESSFGEVIYELGSPEGVYLSGDDSEGSGQLTDNVILIFEMEIDFGGNFGSRVGVSLDSNAAHVQGISIERGSETQNWPTVSQVVELLGNDYRRVHHSIVWDEGELEGTLSDCDDPKGEIETLISRRLGLQVLLTTEGTTKTVRSFHFLTGIKSGKVLFDRCPEEKEKTRDFGRAPLKSRFRISGSICGSAQGDKERK